MTRLQDRGDDPSSDPEFAALLADYNGQITSFTGLPDRPTTERLRAMGDQLLAGIDRAANPMLWAGARLSVGSVVVQLGVESGDPGCLHRAVSLYEGALEEYRERARPLEFARVQQYLGEALDALGDATGDAAYHERSAAAFRCALRVYGPRKTRVEWSKSKIWLGIALRKIHKLAPGPGLLEAAEAAYREGLQASPGDLPPEDKVIDLRAYAALAYSLGAARFDQRYAARAVAAYRRVLRRHGDCLSAVSRADVLHHLGLGLSLLGYLSGSQGRLESAVRAFVASATLRTDPTASATRALTDRFRSTALLRLCALSGDPTRAAEAVEAARRAVDGHPRETSPRSWAASQNALGRAQSRLGALSGDPGRYRAAVRAHRAALEVFDRETAPSSWASTKLSLGRALEKEGAEAASLPLLTEAAQACREAQLEYRVETNPGAWADTQSALGIILSRMADLTHDPDLLTQSVDALRAVVDLYARDPNLRASGASQLNLASALRRVADQKQADSPMDEAIVAYEAAAGAFEREGSADNALGLQTHLVKLLVRRGRYDEAEAAILATLARNDASRGQFRESPESRARLVARTLDLYSHLSLCRIRRADRDLWGALEAAEAGRAQLLGARLAESAGARARRTGRYRRLAASAARAVTRDDIRSAVPEGGALVVPVLTEVAGFVFVLTAGDAEPAVIEMDCDASGARERLFGSENWMGVYGRTVRSADWRRAQAESDGPSAYGRWNGMLETIQAWLWKVFASAVDAHLRDTAGLRESAPVALAPPGLLSGFPLAAAGPDPKGRYFSDHWTISVAPSVRLLRVCQARAATRRLHRVRLLGVVEPTRSSRPLPGARAEAAHLRAYLASTRPTLLEGADATVDAVMRQLPRATHLHVSTHGHHDHAAPHRSAIRLSDGALTLTRLEGARVNQMRLVFLSACESGRSGARRLQDEFVGLPAGFVQAGAACVIGTLWPVFDDAAFLLGSRFYPLHLTGDGAERLPPAVALREAQAWLRQVTFGELRRLFPTVEDGAFLQLSPPSRFTLPTATPTAALKLALGSDDLRPYAQPHEWAGFTLTGA